MEDEKPKIPWWQPGVVLFTRLSGWIAGPVLIGVFVGNWLDKKYDSAPWLFLLSVGLAFAISITGLVREAMKEMKRIEREDKAKKEENNKSK